MMTNIVAIKPTVDDELVEMLEKTLAEAKDGEISAVMLLAQDCNGVRYRLYGIKDRFQVLGWLSHMMHRLQTDDSADV